MWQPIVLGSLAAVAVLVAAAVLARWTFRRRSNGTTPYRPVVDSEQAASDPSIDLDALPPDGVPAAFPRLELLGTRTRLAVLVLAPVGRGIGFPSRQHWHTMVDRIVPGLAKVLDHHRPVFRHWPEQVSQHGFVHAFFNAMRSRDAALLDVERVGTTGPTSVAESRLQWYRVAGRIDWRGQPVLVGLVLCGEGPPMDSIEVEHPGRWLDLLKVRVA